MNDLINRFAQEGSFPLDKDIAARILSVSEDVTINAREDLISYGSVDTNIYIVAEGILRLWHFDGNKEITIGFTDIGTVLMSLMGYFNSSPAYICITACTKARLKKIPKTTFDKIIRESHEFSTWIYSVAIHQLFALERKLSLINGTAKEKYISLIKNRPDIIRNVPGKIIASYLGITPFYLCKLKRELL